MVHKSGAKIFRRLRPVDLSQSYTRKPSGNVLGHRDGAAALLELHQKTDRSYMIEEEATV
jgi:hypothetical protein